jgi:hypothetical protein
MTKPGAEALVAKIREYWARRGYAPVIRVEPENSGFVIRSELRGAQPPVFKSAKTTSVSAETAPEHQPER